MAMLYITELDTLGTPSEGGHCPVARMAPIAEQTLAMTGSSAQSAAFNTATRFIRVETDTTCSLAFGANPTAQSVSTTQTGAGAVGTARLAVNNTEYFAVTPGQKLAAITTT